MNHLATLDGHARERVTPAHRDESGAVHEVSRQSWAEDDTVRSRLTSDGTWTTTKVASNLATAFLDATGRTYLLSSKRDEPTKRKEITELVLQVEECTAPSGHD